MLNDITQNTIASPYSLILSIILFFGVTAIGDFFQKLILQKTGIFKYHSLNIFFSPLIGTYLIIYSIYIFMIFDFQASLVIKLFSYILIIFGLWDLYSNKNIYLSLLKSLRNETFIVVYVLVAFYLVLFLISLSPITHADTLDYHFSGALDILRKGNFHNEILPMNNTLVSIGEIIIAIGLSLGAEQFGSIVQFSGLLALIPIFSAKKNRFFLLAILICPITFFLVSSPKPQLLFNVSSLLIFIFLTNYFYKLNFLQSKISYLIIIFILSLNFITKHSFIVSSSILTLYALSLMYKKRLFWYSFFSSIFIFAITILPFWLIKYFNFETTIFDLIQSPLPINIYGYKYYHEFLTYGSISIFSIFIPPTIGEFTKSFGPLMILMILMINKKTTANKTSFISLLTFILIVIIFGGSLNRFLYEGFLWFIFLLSASNYSNKFFIYNLFKKITYFQSILFFPIVLFFVITIFPGSLVDDYKKKIMKNTANGYELASWVNQNLNDDDILLSTHRSISLFKNKTYSSIFLWGVDLNKDESIIYKNFLSSKKINKIVFYGRELNTIPFNDCLGKMLFFKENVGRKVGRNPFNKGEKYNGWIYEFNYRALPNCLNKKN